MSGIQHSSMIVLPYKIKPRGESMTLRKVVSKKKRKRRKAAGWFWEESTVLISVATISYRSLAKGNAETAE